MNKEYRQKHLKEMQSWSLDRKIEHSLKRIREFYQEMNGKVYVAFSGGVDSTVLLHLVRSLYPDAVAVFSNTTNEYVEILDFIRSIPNVIEVKPEMTFNETVEKYGIPLVSKESAEKIQRIRKDKDHRNQTTKLYLTGYTSEGKFSKGSMLPKKWVFLTEEVFDVTNKCCDILKKRPMKKFEKETGLSPFIGTQAEESKLREKSWKELGCNVYDNKTGISSKPLSIWRKSDIWEYINRFKVAYSEIYKDKLDQNGNIIVDGEKRTGCAYCAFGAHLEKGTNRFQRLSLRKPKQFEKMMNLKNNGVRFEDALHKVGVKTRVDTLFQGSIVTEELKQ